ncbi:MAG TPA: molybdopterin converting factor subunit 1 [Thermoanaerobaculia bacterium]
MQVRLLLFAVLRDIVGAPERRLSLPEGATAMDVWNELRSQFAQLDGYRLPPMIAVNQNYVSPETVLNDGDELAFIPPVAGG